MRSFRCSPAAPVLLALSALWTLAGCHRGDPALPAATPVILISIDTLRSDHLPAYGAQGVETPALDGLRRDAILFEQAFSHVPLTLPAHLSLLSGRLPPEHGVRDNVGFPFAPTAGPWLPEELQKKGYATGGVVSAYVLRAETGISRGFDSYEDGIAFRSGAVLGNLSRPGSESVAKAIGWLGSVRTRPFFLFLHLYEPHAPYTPPEPFAVQYADRPYDGEIAAADQAVGQLLDELRRLGAYDSALIVLTSDHGEGLGDHGEEEHGIFVYREALQVPLIVKLPGGQRAGSTVRRPVQLIDLYPTLAALLGLPLPPDLHGSSLLAEEGSGRPIYAESYYPRFHYGWSELTSLVDGTGRHHYIQAPEPELYDLAADPGEKQNRFAGERRAAGSLKQALAPLLREPAAPAAVDSETRRSLAALGYVSTGPRAGAGPLPDPKRQLPTLADLGLGLRLFHTQRYAEAVPALTRAVAQNPEALDAWDYLGRALQLTGQLPAALRAFEKAVALSGGDPDYALSAALLQLELGQADRAVATVRVALSAGKPDQNLVRRFAESLSAAGRAPLAAELLGAVAGPEPATLAAQGLALSEAGRPAEALAVLQRAEAADGANAATHESLSLVYLRGERWSEARASAERAVQLDPGRANAWNNLGVALYQQGQPAAALDAWERAVQVDPAQYDTLYNLGVKAAELGRADQARRALEQFLATAPPDRYAADLPRTRDLLRRLESR